MTVLFLCTGNSARSQLAEALLRSLTDGRADIYSAGTHPQPDIHPLARRAARGLLGLDMAGQHPKSIDAFLGRTFDYVITVCDRAAETCPVFPGDAERIHWSFEDPAAVPGTDDERLRAFESTTLAILARLRTWLMLPAVQAKLSRRS
jgi:arsenate reductase